MPYILPSDRPQYLPIIEQTLRSVQLSGDCFTQLEHMGYFVWGVFSCLDGFGNYKCPCCNPFLKLCRESEILSAMNSQIEVAADRLTQKDLSLCAGELNYLTSCVVWGVLGDDPSFPRARYPARAYARAMLTVTQDKLESFVPRKQERMRSHLMYRAVLGDIMDELYRRRTAVYEDEKILQNQDIWPLQVEA